MPSLLASILVLLVLGAIMFFAVRHVVRNAKSKKNSCSGDCSCCGGCGSAKKDK